MATGRNPQRILFYRMSELYNPLHLRWEREIMGK